MFGARSVRGYSVHPLSVCAACFALRYVTIASKRMFTHCVLVAPPVGQDLVPAVEVVVVLIHVVMAGADAAVFADAEKSL